MAGVRRRIAAPTSINDSIPKILRKAGIGQWRNFAETYDPVHGWRIAVVNANESLMVVCNETKQEIVVYR